MVSGDFNRGTTLDVGLAFSPVDPITGKAPLSRDILQGISHGHGLLTSDGDPLSIINNTAGLAGVAGLDPNLDLQGLTGFGNAGYQLSQVDFDDPINAFGQIVGAGVTGHNSVRKIDYAAPLTQQEALAKLVNDPDTELSFTNVSLPFFPGSQPAGDLDADQSDDSPSDKESGPSAAAPEPNTLLDDATIEAALPHYIPYRSQTL